MAPAFGAEGKCWHGSLPAAIDGIPENICSSRAFLRLTPRRHARPKIAVVQHGLAALISPVSIYCFDHRDLLAKIDRDPACPAGLAAL